jgi:hypothetical protein
VKKSPREKRLEYALKKLLAKILVRAPEKELLLIIRKALSKPALKQISKQRWDELKKAYVKFHPRA